VMNGLVLAAVALVMAVGLIGTVLPLVPGTTLILAAALGYGLVEGFGPAGGVAVAAMAFLLVCGVVLKYALPHRRGKASGAPTSTLIVGALAGIVAFFVVPVVGLPLGAVSGVLIAEYARTQQWPVAWRSTRAVIVGIGLGTALEFGAGLLMIGCWVAWVFVQV
jgi:uncharacterized protein